MTEARTKKIAKKIIFYISIVLITIIWLTPVITLILTSIKSRQDFYSNISLFELPEKIAWSNFTNAVIQGRLFLYMKNDLIISCLKVPAGIFVEAMAAFAITRLKVKRPTMIFVFFLIGMMLPHQIALVPLNVAYSRLHLMNTYFGLFYAYIGFGISYGILILRGFFRGIPKEMDEAAMMDGCTKWGLFSKIILPMAKPAVSTLMIMDFLSTWNEYLVGSVIINRNEMKTVPVGLMTFVGENGTDYGYLCAGVLVSIIPVIIVYLIFQRNFVEGMSGAVK